MLVRLTGPKITGRLRKARARKETRFWTPSEPPAWLAVSTRISALGLGSVICLLPEPPGDAHPPGIFFLLDPSQKPFSDTKLKLDSTTVIPCFTSGKASVDTSPYTCNPRTTDGGSQTVHVALDSECKAAFWGSLGCFFFPHPSMPQVYVPTE